MKASQRPVASALRRRHEVTWLAAGVIAAAIAMSAGSARAESNFVNGSGTATAHLNFSIVIPKFLYLQVGTGTYPTSVNTVDTILFDMTGAISSIGNATPQAGTGGDLTGGAVTARVVGNNFNAAVNLSASTVGAMSNGAGNTISWSEISVTSAALAVVPAAASTLNHPGTAAAPFADGAATTVSLTPVGKVINQSAKWTFQYKNSNVPSAGTYGNTVANNGQVTYTITMP
ncbi:MAG TPA: hypothetical protein VMN56_21615 [Casimicrobiaceae bacterium]|nr:hypothetical protein [Casimicrobiaceae bacterium]